MQQWIKISSLLCTFGFFRELRPNEPFVVEFLSNETWKDVTLDQVNKEIYPAGTYSYLIQLCIVFLITDILRYKPIIIASACSGIIMWILLLWTRSLAWLYVVQIFYGFYMASEVAYYTYIYAKVPKDKYQRVTGYTRASLLTGKFLAGVLAQLLHSFNVMDFRELNFISLGTQIISFGIAVMLPSVAVSLYMWRVDDDENNKNAEMTIDENVQNAENKVQFSWERASKLLWNHFKTSYSNRTILVFSIFWALSTAGYILIISYVQVLWKEINSDQENLYNGAVEALLTFSGALSASLGGHVLQDSFQKYDYYILTVASLLQGGLTLVSAYTSSIWIAYFVYILVGIIYNFIITLVTAFVAKFLSDDSFALIFGINTLMAISVQSVLTVLFVAETASFTLTAREQFFVFSMYFFGLGVIFIVTSVVKILRK